MATSADHYKALQVDPEAEPEVIRAAFRALAQKHHPDVYGGCQEKMAALNGAWTVLRDPVRRADYDRTLAELRTTRTETPAHGASRDSRIILDEDNHRAPATMPPPGNPSGSVLDFGRYAGWSLGEIVRYDPEFLEWLERTPIGRAFHSEIDALLRSRSHAATAVADRGRPRGSRRR